MLISGHDVVYDGWEYNPFKRCNEYRHKCKICGLVFVGGTESIGADFDYEKMKTICQAPKKQKDEQEEEQ